MVLTKYGRFWAVYDAGALGPRVHSLARHFLAGKTLNGLVVHEDWMVTCLAAAGAPDIKEQLLEGGTFAGRQYRAPPDGYNQLGYPQWQDPGVALDGVLVGYGIPWGNGSRNCSDTGTTFMVAYVRALLYPAGALLTRYTL